MVFTVFPLFLFLQDGGGGARPVAIDVSVVHPPRLPSRPSVLIVGGVAREGAEEKRAYYRERCR